MDIISLITENALILIPALYILGMFLKKTPRCPDWLIPYILLVCGIAGAVGIMGISTQSVAQGVFVTGVAVLGNQLFKQGFEGLDGLRK